MKAIVVGCAVIICVFVSKGYAVPMFYYADNVADYSQHLEQSWSGYCTPTAAANIVSWFADNGYPDLMPDGTSAITLINTLATYMHTNQGVSGTTFQNAVTGLESYIDDYDSGILDRPTDGLYIDYMYRPQTGVPTWSWLTDKLSTGSLVLVFATYYGNTSPFGHVTTAVGYGEEFIDANGNGYIDAGELYFDLNQNEDYDPNLLVLHDPDDHDTTADDFYLVNNYIVPYPSGTVLQPGFEWTYSSYSGTALIEAFISVSPFSGGETQFDGDPVSVPEPSSLILLSCSIVMLARRRLKL